MEVELIVNSDVSLVLVPKNAMEEELLKQLMKQDNTLTEIRTGIPLVNKTIHNGIMICKRTNKKEDEEEPDKTEKSDQVAS